LKTTLRLLHFLQPFSRWVLLSTLLGAATIASSIGLLGTSAFLIARAALHPSIADLQVAIVGVRFFGISRALLRYLERLTSHATNFRLLAQLRVWFYRAVEPLAPAQLLDQHSGNLLNRAISDIETLENFYVRAVAPPLTALIVTLGLAAYVGQFSLQLSGVLVGGLLLSGIAVPLLTHKLSQHAGKTWGKAQENLSSSWLDLLQGLPDLLIFEQAASALERVRQANQRSLSAQQRLIWTGAISNALNTLLTNFTLIIVLVISIPLVSHASLDGVLLAVLTLITLAGFEAVTPLATAAQFWQSSQSAAARLFELADRPIIIAEPDQPFPIPTQLHLSIRNLTFAYPNTSTPVLRDIYFDIPDGAHIALVGPSGSGKSTLLTLLLRFWDVPPCTLWLGQQDLRSFSPEALRNHITAALQPPYLFTATLRQNLLLGNPQASEAQLWEALHTVNLDHWANNLPDRLDTWLGEQGAIVSGGEQQRIALARTLLRPGSLTLLDEPTANLDAETERTLLQRLPTALTGRSVLWVTHRLTGLESFDTILVLDQGCIVERGTHASLLAQGGLYAKMFNIQRNTLAQTMLQSS
jgi:ATP-binding cassette subfamily C protein CydC